MATLIVRKPIIIAISGSVRTGSVNVLLAKCAARIAEAQGAVSEYIDLSEYPIPIFHGDIEGSFGLPKEVRDLKAKFDAADGIIVCTPEYNGCLSPLLLNSFAWMSRPHEKNEAIYKVFKGKHATIMAASPGAMGGLRALGSLREVLVNLGTNVLSDQAALGGAFSAFDAEGQLKDPKQAAMVERVVHGLVEHARTHANSAVMCEFIAKRLLQHPRSGEYGSVTMASSTA